MENMELQFNQAIKLKNDFLHLEGKTFNIDGIELTVQRVAIAPWYSEKLNKFIENYYKSRMKSGDDETLVTQLNPSSYSVFVFYNELNGITLYDNIFNLDESLSINIDINKYK
jgi:hypothetical protein